MSHRLKIDVPTEPVHVFGDPQRLTQVFGNLLHNACKYTSNGGAIELDARVEDGIVQVSVVDNGIGIPPDRLDEVFDLFVQVETSLERAQGGLGIGLTLVRRLVEMHGGQVHAHSQGVGHGSRFVVRLPTTADTAALAMGGEPLLLSAPELPRRRILVVDDNRDAADTLGLALSIVGHHVQTLHDPLLVIDAIGSFQPEIAFLDVGMPRLNGLKLASMIREREGGDGIVLVALTGWGQENDRQRSHEAGFDYHLVKPADPDEIDRICRDPLRRRSTV